MKNSDEKKQIFAVCSILTAIFCFYLCAGLLYPMRGDDFLCQHMLRTMSVPEIIYDSYLNWTLRLGNIINTVIVSGGSKLPFDVLNSIIQVLIIILIAMTAADGKLRFSSERDMLTLIFAAGLSFFVCRPADTVYWIPGSTLYSWSAVVYLGAWLMLRHCEKNKPDWKNIAIVTLLAVLAGYTNENVALAGVLLLGARAWVKPSKTVFCALAGYFAGGVFMFTTPGVLKRIAHETSSGNGAELSNIAGMFGKLPEIAGFYLVSSAVPLLVLMVVLLVFRRGLAVGTLKKTAAVAGLSVFSALVFAGCPLPPMRSYYVCSLLVIISAVIVFNEAQVELRLKKYTALAMVLAAVVLMLSALPDFVTIRRDEMQRRQIIAQSMKSGVKEVVVPPHRCIRRSLLQYIFIEDITADPDFWLNRNAALYFNVEKIRTTAPVAVSPSFRNNFMKFIRMEK